MGRDPRVTANVATANTADSIVSGAIAARNAFIDATDVGPLFAIQRGYLEGAAEMLPDTSPLRNRILALLSESDEIMNRFEAGSREHFYLIELRMIGAALAQGMTQRSRTRCERLSGAKQEREISMQRIVQTQTLIGVLRGGVQITLIGGFAYAIVESFFHLPFVQSFMTEKTEKNFASLATALGSALVGSFFKAWWIGYQVNLIARKYDAEVRRINRDYAESVKQEYAVAAQEANLAWRRFTGRDPDVTSAFHELLMEAVSQEHRTADDIPDPPTLSARFVGYLQSLMPRRGPKGPGRPPQ